MKQVIITTTINSPTDAIRKYDWMEDWKLIVVGDKKTPQYDLWHGHFVHWEEAESLYPDLCRLVGWNCTQLGRMIGLLEARKHKPDVVCSIDDDCDPYDGWPGPVHIGLEITARKIECKDIAFDPFWNIYKHPPRGFPPQIHRPRIYGSTHDHITPLIQENLWDGEADYDAVWRVHGSEFEWCSCEEPYWSDKFSPINTQNTIVSGSVLKDWCGELPFVGHVGDIWAGYLLQARHPNATIYCPRNVRHWQQRSLESVLADLEDEVYSYRYTLDFLQDLIEHGPDNLDHIPLPYKTKEAINIYRSYFE